MTKRSRISGMVLAAVAAGLTFAAPPVHAQAARGEDDVIIKREPLGRSLTTRAPIEMVSVSIVVHTSDLNLLSADGVSQLTARIDSASRRACDRLDQIFPITAEGSPRCFDETYNQGMRDAEAVIRLAQAAGAAPE